MTLLQITPEAAAAASLRMSKRRTICSFNNHQAILYSKEHAFQHMSNLLKKETYPSPWKEAQNCSQIRQQNLQMVHAQEVVVIPDAFNSQPAFLDTFQSAAMIGLPMRSEFQVQDEVFGLELSSLIRKDQAKRQGWHEDGFGSHVYRFVRDEMAATAHQDKNSQQQQQQQQRHFFYVWSPETDWYPVFEIQQAKKPLGPQFGGYHHELPAICLRMRSDRETLIRTTTYGRTAVFLLLIPAHEQIFQRGSVHFHEDLLPLTVTGQPPNGNRMSYVWMDITHPLTDDCGQLRLQNIMRSNVGHELTVCVAVIGCYFVIKLTSTVAKTVGWLLYLPSFLV